MNKNFPVLLLHSLCIYLLNAESLVEISQGILNGTIQVSRNGRIYSAFLGIPFGKPPIGNLRFANPVPAGKWSGIRPANSFGNICVQNDKGHIRGKEDCLFLNVYTPRLQFNSSSTLLPVMVWIHGGSFNSGSSNMFGAQYLLDKDVILVTINYRLGIFGFLSTGDSVAPGNFGMKDQVLALKWVQKNIQAFGGDNNRVTLLGQSAGGASVSLHAISKASSGLFHRYIIQSGPNLSPWAYQKRSNYVIFIRGIAALVFCPFFTSHSAVHCLRNKSVKSLIKTSAIFGTIARFAQLTWTPTDEPDDEGAFLTDSPQNLVKQNQMKDLPFISGVTSDEGLFVTSGLYSNDVLYGVVKLSLNNLITYFADYYFESKNKDGFTAAVKNFYFNDTLISTGKYEFLERLTRLVSDGFFHYPQLTMLQKVTPKMNSSNYFYNFGYLGTAAGPYSRMKNNGNHGVGHEEEVRYIFSVPSLFSKFTNLNHTKIDTSISKLMVDMWTSFASNGKPISNELNKYDLWKPYTPENPSHLQIGSIHNNTDPGISLSNTFHTNRMDFWRKYAPI
ncbi:esterase FE4-like [Belonocnema kinseyi]|uniref:esterase FE4-like n=1 Tax=Belonocnema kinseyi TaxID=2817044 RepID=UPI00143E0A76|nr:esterase FE4-like [Belonocnema kinseyi]